MPKRTSDESEPTTSTTEAPEAPAAEATETPAPEAEQAPSPAADAATTEDAPRGAPEAEPRTCPHGAVSTDCPLCALDAGLPQPEPPVAAEPAADEPVDDVPADLDDEAWAEALAAAPDEADLPLDEGEEITAERTDESGDLIVVTSFGRKIGISPDGWIAVLMGPDLAARVPSVPKPPRSSWKDPR